MKSFFLVEPGRIELRETPIPHPQDGELPIEVATALTCGTDFKAHRRGHPKMPMPIPFGQELSGIIADAGKSVNGWHEGDASMDVHTAPCGDCYFCGRQLEILCDATMGSMLLGAYAEYIKLPRRVVGLKLISGRFPLTDLQQAFVWRWMGRGAIIPSSHDARMRAVTD